MFSVKWSVWANRKSEKKNAFSDRKGSLLYCCCCFSFSSVNFRETLEFLFSSSSSTSSFGGKRESPKKHSPMSIEEMIRALSELFVRRNRTLQCNSERERSLPIGHWWSLSSTKRVPRREKRKKKEFSLFCRFDCFLFPVLCPLLERSRNYRQDIEEGDGEKWKASFKQNSCSMRGAQWKLA